MARSAGHPQAVHGTAGGSISLPPRQSGDERGLPLPVVAGVPAHPPYAHIRRPYDYDFLPTPKLNYTKIYPLRPYGAFRP